jgi:hypothetical protein
MMTEITGMREILLSDEINGLISMPYAPNSDLSVCCETVQSGNENDIIAASGLLVQSEIETDIVGSQEKTLSSAAEAIQLAISLHKSLSLGEILLSCKQALEKYFSLEFIRLIQPRVDIIKATVYSLEERGNSPLVMPCVINLEPSRLKECLQTKQIAIKYSAQGCVLDDIERDFLCPEG